MKGYFPWQKLFAIIFLSVPGTFFVIAAFYLLILMSQSMRDGVVVGMFFFMLFIGMMFLSIAVIIMCVGLSLAVKKKRLIENGKKLTAKVVEVIRGSMVGGGVGASIEFAHRLRCKYKDEVSGKTYYFESRDRTISPKLLGSLTGEPISVYVNCADYTDYYVDTDSLLSRYIVF